ncbi:MarR family winged helix-turn-helix transcriptional regulator [Bifidobacterium subtile]|jgi:DNA-binding MarR family transcriptional regulator|uniref:MarR family winged helix-turn-helix transcriptional regulator n=1 Tax=Bifidobacterium subtile TaxID=77635 RepID=UPI002F35F9A2
MNDEYLDADAALGDISERLLSFVQAYQRLGEREHTFGSLKLSMAEIRMLNCVASHNGASLADLSQALRQSRSASYQMVMRLVSLGLIEKNDSLSGRKVAVSLSNSGASVYVTYRRRLSRLSRQINDVLGKYPEEFLTAMRRLMDELEDAWNDDSWLLGGPDGMGTELLSGELGGKQ